MTISTIRVIIRSFQSTENVMSLPGRRRVYIVLMHSEKVGFEWPKDSSMITAGELGLENLKK